MHIGIVGHHLLKFAAQCKNDDSEASFYADPSRSKAPGGASLEAATAATSQAAFETTR